MSTFRLKLSKYVIMKQLLLMVTLSFFIFFFLLSLDEGFLQIHAATYHSSHNCGYSLHCFLFCTGMLLRYLFKEMAIFQAGLEFI